MRGGLVLLVSVLVLLASCGSGSDDREVTAGMLTDAAAAADRYHLSQTSRAVLDDQVQARTVEADIDVANQRSVTRTEKREGDDVTEFLEVLRDEVRYLFVPEHQRHRSNDRTWAAEPAPEDSHQMLVRPDEFLDQLPETGMELTEVGTGTVNGLAVTEYEVTYTEAEAPPGDITGKAYVTEGGVLTRLTFEMKGTSAEDMTFTMEMVMNLTAFGATFDVPEIDDAEVFWVPEDCGVRQWLQDACAPAPPAVPLTTSTTTFGNDAPVRDEVVPEGQADQPQS